MDAESLELRMHPFTYQLKRSGEATVGGKQVRENWKRERDTKKDGLRK